MPLYAQYGVKYLWLIHPIKKTLATYKLLGDQWRSQGIFGSGSSVSVEPFEQIKLTVDDLME